MGALTLVSVCRKDVNEYKYIIWIWTNNALSNSICIFAITFVMFFILFLWHKQIQTVALRYAPMCKSLTGPVRTYHWPSLWSTQFIHALTVMSYGRLPEQNNQNLLSTLAGYSNRCSPFKRRITTLISLSPSPSPLGCEYSSLCVPSGSSHFCHRTSLHGRQLFGCEN